MQHHTRLASLAAALLALAAGAATAQPHTPKIAGSAALKARAKVSGDSATKVARAQVPNGKIQSAELEEEKGKLLYSFDIKVPGKSGVEEVHVDALTGAVLAREHETAASEKAEKKAAKSTKKP
jgi:uncharacterized membrane protein YkoI